MGCDIHAHVETGYINREGKMTWSHLCDFGFGRNYLLFALMAGVRRYNYLPSDTELAIALEKRGVKTLDDPLLSEAETQVIIQEASDSGITKGQPSFEEKGAPSDMSWKTAMEYTYTIVDDDADDDEEGCVKRSKAEEWVKSGSSDPWDTIDGKVVRITGPDWHTPSWLDTAEMEVLAERMRVVVLQNEYYRDDSVATVEGLVEMMKRLERDGKIKARVVFWFDN